MSSHPIPTLTPAFLTSVLRWMLVASWSGLPPVMAAEGGIGFSRTSVDIGLVVRDVDKAAAFYTEGIGFTEAGSFAMSGELARNVGFTKPTPIKVRVLVLGEAESATRLKLIPFFQQESPGETDRTTNSRSGFCYITVFVTDIDRALAKLKEAGAGRSAKGPVKLGDNSRHEVFVTVVRDPDGNLVELVGPRNNQAKR